MHRSRAIWPAFKDKLKLVVGKARFTPDGYEIGDEGLVYLDAADDGDGRVTRQARCCPACALGNSTASMARCPTRSLPSRLTQLLEIGTTNLLTPLAEVPRARGAAAAQTAHVRSRPSRTRVTGPPPDNAHELLTLDSQQTIAGPSARGAALQVTVINGDLRFIRQPLLIGHYRSLRLSGTEAVMNGLIGGAMEESLRIGLYPVPTGTHQVFVNTQADPDNPWQPPRPEAGGRSGSRTGGRTIPHRSRAYGAPGHDRMGATNGRNERRRSGTLRDRCDADR